MRLYILDNHNLIFEPPSGEIAHLGYQIPNQEDIPGLLAFYMPYLTSIAHEEL